MNRVDLWGLAMGGEKTHMSPALELLGGREGEAEVAELPKEARVLGSWDLLGHGLEVWSP